MAEDVDEWLLEKTLYYKRPETTNRLLEAIEWHLRYGIGSLKVIGWLVVILLGLVVWRVW